MLNQIMVVGQVCKSPKYSESPAGIVHGQFSIEHRSTQYEAEFERGAYFRIHVVTCGEAFKQLTKDLKIGDAIQVNGFLNRHESKNGQAILALHAQQIELLN